METERVKVSRRRHNRSRLAKGEVIVYARCLVRVDTTGMKFKDFPKDTLNNGLSRINQYLDEERISIVELQGLLDSGEMSSSQFAVLIATHDACDS